MTGADLEIYRELRGTTCACGATKKGRQSFCRACYFRLPKGTQRELYEVEGYPETYRRACGLLGLREPAERAQLSQPNSSAI